MCVATNGMGKTQQTPDFIRLPKSRDCASKIHSPSQHSAASHREGTGLCRSACVASILATTPAGRLPQFCAVRAPFARRKIARTRPRNVETVSRACSCRVPIETRCWHLGWDSTSRLLRTLPTTNSPPLPVSTFCREPTAVPVLPPKTSCPDRPQTSIPARTPGSRAAP